MSGRHLQMRTVTAAAGRGGGRGLTRQERVDAQAAVLVRRAAHVHHVGVAGVVGRVGAEVRQHHAAHRQQEPPLVVVSRVRQRRAHVPAVEQEREAQQRP